MAQPTAAFTAFAVEPFPTVTDGDDLARLIAEAAATAELHLADRDIVVVTSKVVSIAEKCRVDLATVTPSPAALALAERTGKPAPVVQLILDESTEHDVAGDGGPIIAWHRLGLRLTSAGVDRDGASSAWLLPADPDASARALRNRLAALLGVDLAVVIADSDGRADRAGATVISIGAAGIEPLRTTDHRGESGVVKQQAETLTDLVAAAAGLILGQRGRGAPVAVLRGVAYDRSDAGVASMLHRATG